MLLDDHSEETYRLLIQSVVDYAIYVLTPEGIVANWNQVQSGLKVIRRRRLLVSTSRASTPKKNKPLGSRYATLRPRVQPGASKHRDGA